ncbi:MAG: isoprenylcysteine carboxylmethyltransferase family protein [Bacteroidota bacterium]
MNFLFRPSTSTDPRWNVTKTFLQTTVFWLVFLYLLPMGIQKMEAIYQLIGFGPRRELGWGLFALFSILGIWSGYTMSSKGRGTPLPLDCPNELVVEGPYQFVRNPMAVAGIGQGLCVGLILGSYWVMAYAMADAVLWHLLVRPVEEQDLEKRFGDSYLAYKRQIKCWIPGFDYSKDTVN